MKCQPFLRSHYIRSRFPGTGAARETLACKQPRINIATLDPGEGDWSVASYPQELSSDGQPPEPRHYFIRPAAGAHLPGGWYLIEIKLSSDELPVRAEFFPDYGKGIDAATSGILPLARVANGWLQAIARFTHDLFRLRLDTLALGQGLGLRQVRLRRMGKKECAIRMTKALAMRTGQTPYRTVALLANLLWKLAHAGPKGVGEKLYDNYALQQDPGERYQGWVRLYGSAAVADLDIRIEAMDPKPQFSLVLATHNTPEPYLRRCIKSVIAQRYPHWKLYVVDASSTDPHVMSTLEEFTLVELRVVLAASRPGISHALAIQRGIRRAGGSHIAILGDRDKLHEMALYWMADAANRDPDCKIIYSDEDKIDGSGQLSDPYFKPDWNYELLLSQNYIHHLCVFDSAVLKRAGGYEPGFDGSEDYDLLLRCLELVTCDQVRHVPIVLYHWDLESASSLQKPSLELASKGALKALGNHFSRLGSKAWATAEPRGLRRIWFPLPNPAPLVSVIIPTRNKFALLQPCVEAVRRSNYPNVELLVVDNGSGEPETLRYLQEIALWPNVRVLRYDAPFNYSAINNFAVSQAKGSVIGLLNNDVEAISLDWMEELVSHAVRPEVGLVGAMLFYPDGTIQHAGVIVGLGGVAGHAYAGKQRGFPGHQNRGLMLQSLSAVTAACMFFRRDVFDQVGGLDENLAVAYNDVDLCLRVREAGYRNVWTPFAELYHVESASRGSENSAEQKLRFRGEANYLKQRWGDRLMADPAYNPNLSLCSQVSDLAFPPRR